MLYPEGISYKLKKNDILSIGFKGLIVKVISKNKQHLKVKVLNSGYLENNKGVHVTNRKIKLKYITDKDYEAIKIAKKYKIKFFALSFTNSVQDIINFNKLLKKETKIFKIETSSALSNIDKIITKGKKIFDR